MRTRLLLAVTFLCACSSTASPVEPVAPLTTAEPAPLSRPDPCETAKATATSSNTPEDHEALAVCYDQNGLLISALRESQRGLERGIETRNADARGVSRAHVRTLLDRIPHVTFVPDDAEALGVLFDGRPVPVDALSKKFSVDAGEHAITAVGRRNGKTVKHEERIKVAERDFVTIQLKLE